jgi:hypothetical protein
MILASITPLASLYITVVDAARLLAEKWVMRSCDSVVDPRFFAPLG